MRCLIAFCVLGVSASAGPAQEIERVDADKVTKFATPLANLAGELKDLPVKVAPDAAKAMAIAKGDHAALVIPDAKLTREAIEKVDREILPAGYLFLHKITPIIAGSPLPLGQRRTVALEHDGKTATVAVLPLAIGKIAGRTVLLIYTNEKSAAHVVPLYPDDTARDHPLDLDAQPGEGRASLVIHVLGKHRASIGVAPSE